MHWRILLLWNSFFGADAIGNIFWRSRYFLSTNWAPYANDVVNIDGAIKTIHQDILDGNLPSYIMCPTISPLSLPQLPSNNVARMEQYERIVNSTQAQLYHSAVAQKFGLVISPGTFTTLEQAQRHYKSVLGDAADTNDNAAYFAFKPFFSATDHEGPQNRYQGPPFDFGNAFQKGDLVPLKADPYWWPWAEYIRNGAGTDKDWLDFVSHSYVSHNPVLCWSLLLTGRITKKSSVPSVVLTNQNQIAYSKKVRLWSDKCIGTCNSRSLGDTPCSGPSLEHCKADCIAQPSCVGVFYNSVTLKGVWTALLPRSSDLRAADGPYDTYLEKYKEDTRGRAFAREESAPIMEHEVNMLSYQMQGDQRPSSKYARPDACFEAGHAVCYVNASGWTATPDEGVEYARRYVRQGEQTPGSCEAKCFGNPECYAWTWKANKCIITTGFGQLTSSTINADTDVMASLELDPSKSCSGTNQAFDICLNRCVDIRDPLQMGWCNKQWVNCVRRDPDIADVPSVTNPYEAAVVQMWKDTGCTSDELPMDLMGRYLSMINSQETDQIKNMALEMKTWCDCAFKLDSAPCVAPYTVGKATMKRLCNPQSTCVLVQPADYNITEDANDVPQRKAHAQNLRLCVGGAMENTLLAQADSPDQFVNKQGFHNNLAHARRSVTVEGIQGAYESEECGNIGAGTIHGNGELDRWADWSYSQGGVQFKHMPDNNIRDNETNTAALSSKCSIPQNERVPCDNNQLNKKGLQCCKLGDSNTYYYPRSPLRLASFKTKTYVTSGEGSEYASVTSSSDCINGKCEHPACQFQTNALDGVLDASCLKLTNIEQLLASFATESQTITGMNVNTTQKDSQQINTMCKQTFGDSWEQGDGSQMTKGNGLQNGRCYFNACMNKPLRAKNIMDETVVHSDCKAILSGTAYVGSSVLYDNNANPLNRQVYALLKTLRGKTSNATTMPSSFARALLQNSQRVGQMDVRKFVSCLKRFSTDFVTLYLQLLTNLARSTLMNVRPDNVPGRTNSLNGKSLYDGAAPTFAAKNAQLQFSNLNPKTLNNKEISVTYLDLQPEQTVANLNYNDEITGYTKMSREQLWRSPLPNERNFAETINTMPQTNSLNVPFQSSVNYGLMCPLGVKDHMFAQLTMKCPPSKPIRCSHMSVVEPAGGTCAVQHRWFDSFPKGSGYQKETLSMYSDAISQDCQATDDKCIEAHNKYRKVNGCFTLDNAIFNWKTRQIYQYEPNRLIWDRGNIWKYPYYYMNEFTSCKTSQMKFPDEFYQNPGITSPCYNTYLKNKPNPSKSDKAYFMACVMFNMGNIINYFDPGFVQSYMLIARKDTGDGNFQYEERRYSLQNILNALSNCFDPDFPFTWYNEITLTTQSLYPGVYGGRSQYTRRYMAVDWQKPGESNKERWVFGWPFVKDVRLSCMLQSTTFASNPDGCWEFYEALYDAIKAGLSKHKTTVCRTWDQIQGGNQDQFTERVSEDVAQYVTKINKHSPCNVYDVSCHSIEDAAQMEVCGKETTQDGVDYKPLAGVKCGTKPFDTLENGFCGVHKDGEQLKFTSAADAHASCAIWPTGKERICKPGYALVWIKNKPVCQVAVSASKQAFTAVNDELPTMDVKTNQFDSSMYYASSKCTQQEAATINGDCVPKVCRQRSSQTECEKQDLRHSTQDTFQSCKWEAGSCAAAFSQTIEQENNLWWPGFVVDKDAFAGVGPAYMNQFDACASTEKGCQGFTQCGNNYTSAETCIAEVSDQCCTDNSYTYYTQHFNSYISGWACGTKTSFSDLETAQKACNSAPCCGGVTLSGDAQSGSYTLRSGNTHVYSYTDEISWLKKKSDNDLKFTYSEGNATCKASPSTRCAGGKSLFYMDPSVFTSTQDQQIQCLKDGDSAEFHSTPAGSDGCHCCVADCKASVVPVNQSSLYTTQLGTHAGPRRQIQELYLSFVDTSSFQAADVQSCLGADQRLSGALYHGKTPSCACLAPPTYTLVTESSAPSTSKPTIFFKQPAAGQLATYCDKSPACAGYSNSMLLLTTDIGFGAVNPELPYYQKNNMMYATPCNPAQSCAYTQPDNQIHTFTKQGLVAQSDKRLCKTNMYDRRMLQDWCVSTGKHCMGLVVNPPYICLAMADDVHFLYPVAPFEPTDQHVSGTFYKRYDAQQNEVRWQKPEQRKIYRIDAGPFYPSLFLKGFPTTATSVYHDINSAVAYAQNVSQSIGMYFFQNGTFSVVQADHDRQPEFDTVATLNVFRLAWKNTGCDTELYSFAINDVINDILVQTRTINYAQQVQDYYEYCVNKDPLCVQDVNNPPNCTLQTISSNIPIRDDICNVTHSCDSSNLLNCQEVKLMAYQNGFDAYYFGQNNTVCFEQCEKNERGNSNSTDICAFAKYPEPDNVISILSKMDVQHSCPAEHGYASMHGTECCAHPTSSTDCVSCAHDACRDHASAARCPEHKPCVHGKSVLNKRTMQCQCVCNAFFTGPLCDRCSRSNTKSDCKTCKDGFKIGNGDTCICRKGFDVQSNCTTCLDGFVGDDCDVDTCTFQWDDSINHVSVNNMVLAYNNQSMLYDGIYGAGHGKVPYTMQNSFVAQDGRLYWLYQASRVEIGARNLCNMWNTAAWNAQESCTDGYYKNENGIYDCRTQVLVAERPRTCPTCTFKSDQDVFDMKAANTVLGMCLKNTAVFSPDPQDFVAQVQIQVGDCTGECSVEGSHCADTDGTAVCCINHAWTSNSCDLDNYDFSGITHHTSGTWLYSVPRRSEYDTYATDEAVERAWKATGCSESLPAQFTQDVYLNSPNRKTYLTQYLEQFYAACTNNELSCVGNSSSTTCVKQQRIITEGSAECAIKHNCDANDLLSCQQAAHLSAKSSFQFYSFGAGSTLCVGTNHSDVRRTNAKGLLVTRKDIIVDAQTWGARCWVNRTNNGGQLNQNDNLDYDRDEILLATLNTETAQSCAEACYEESSCTAFVWQSKLCRLVRADRVLRSAEYHVDPQNCVSGGYLGTGRWRNLPNAPELAQPLANERLTKVPAHLMHTLICAYEATTVYFLSEYRRHPWSGVSCSDIAVTRVQAAWLQSIPRGKPMSMLSEQESHRNWVALQQWTAMPFDVETTCASFCDNSPGCYAWYKLYNGTCIAAFNYPSDNATITIRPAFSGGYKLPPKFIDELYTQPTQSVAVAHVQPYQTNADSKQECCQRCSGHGAWRLAGAQCFCYAVNVTGHSDCWQDTKPPENTPCQERVDMVRHADKRPTDVPFWKTLPQKTSQQQCRDTCAQTATCWVAEWTSLVCKLYQRPSSMPIAFAAVPGAVAFVKSGNCIKRNDVCTYSYAAVPKGVTPAGVCAAQNAISAVQATAELFYLNHTDQTLKATISESCKNTSAPLYPRALAPTFGARLKVIDIELLLNRMERIKTAWEVEANPMLDGLGGRAYIDRPFTQSFQAVMTAETLPVAPGSNPSVYLRPNTEENTMNIIQMWSQTPRDGTSDACREQASLATLSVGMGKTPVGTQCYATGSCVPPARDTGALNNVFNAYVQQLKSCLAAEHSDALHPVPVAIVLQPGTNFYQTEYQNIPVYVSSLNKVKFGSTSQTVSELLPLPTFPTPQPSTFDTPSPVPPFSDRPTQTSDSCSFTVYNDLTFVDAVTPQTTIINSSAYGADHSAAVCRNVCAKLLACRFFSYDASKSLCVLHSINQVGCMQDAALCDVWVEAAENDCLVTIPPARFKAQLNISTEVKQDCCIVQV